MKTKIVCYSTGSLGDTLLIVPAIKYIRTIKPDAEITLLSDFQGSGNYLLPETILKDTGLIDKYLTYQCNLSSLKQILEYIKLFYKIFLRFDELYYFQEVWIGSKRILRDKLFFKLSGIKNIYGLQNLSEKPKIFIKTISRAEEILIRLGFSYKNSQKWVHENININKQVFSSNLLINNIDFKKTYVLSPFSNMPSKNWPLDRYIEIAKFIYLKYKLIPVLIGPERDLIKTNQLINILGFGKNLCGSLNFTDVKYVVSNSIFYIGNDSGLMHLANALRIPTLNIFSARDFWGRWEPVGDKNVNLRYDLECSCCHKYECNINNLCLTNISTLNVKDALVNFLDQYLDISSRIT
jgi:ADP-heptose:LPS heptosyltransferase